MECKPGNEKCVCRTCKYLKDHYCEKFKSNNTCDNCDYKGYTVSCSKIKDEYIFKKSIIENSKKTYTIIGSCNDIKIKD